MFKHYIKPLTYLINSFFESGTFLEELKLAKVIPILKSGDKQDISNYRPISILSFFSKVFEKTMYNHLITFIDANKIVYKYQFGFRKSHSTNHVIISLVEKVNTAKHSILLIIVSYYTNFTNMVIEEHLGTGLKAIWKIENNMYATVILYLQPCQLHMEYHRDPY